MHKTETLAKIFGLHPKVTKFYYHRTLYSFAASMVSIFVPIYLLTLNYSFLAVLGWLLIGRVLDPISGFFAVKLDNIIGMKKAILLSLILTVVIFFLLWQLETNPILFFPIILVYSFTRVNYWMQCNALFMEVAKPKEMGTEAGVIDGLETFTGLIAPLIGAYILVELGMPILLAVTSAILMISIIPVLMIKGAHFKIKTSFHDHTKKHTFDPKLLIEMLHRGFQSNLLNVIFPLYLFLAGFEIIDIGVIAVLLALSGVFTPLLFGKLIDKDPKNRERFTMLGTILSIIVWVTIAIYPNEILFYVAAFLLGLVAELIWHPVKNKISILGKQKDPCFFGFVYEISDDMGRAIALIVVITVLLLFNLQIALIATTVLMLIFVIWKWRTS